ncbi:MAG TPA: CDGSH iron-sulfur domain-containing protein [Actinomycetota bacterium]|nr:CDGSH iron-sulfur domain-containing protein [Actinomycetota bacterium]
MEDPRIRIRPRGPYVVSGDPPLLRTAIVKTEHREPVDWDEGPSFSPPAGEYLLCRCGASPTLPFCDGSCESLEWEDALTADRGPTAERRSLFEGEDLELTDDLSLCSKAGFCTNLSSNVWDLVEESDDPDAREQLVGMVQRCPSGRLVLREAPSGAELEPELEPSIGVQPSGPFWVRGMIPVESEDGLGWEVRNRMTLCRCGSSRNKPFCDGSHKVVGFRDAAMPARPEGTDSALEAP